MQKYRYPGVKPFAEDDKDIFFGREDDINKLIKIINLKKITVIYSKSGYGKSSLIQAGILPVIKETMHIIPIRFQNYISNKLSNTPLETAKTSLFLVQKSFLNKILKKRKSLWYYLKNRQLYNSIKGRTTKIVILLDQFEELFSYPKEQVIEFANEFSEIVNSLIPQHYINALEDKIKENPNFLSPEEMEFLYQKIEVKIVFSIRSDKLSYVNRLKPYIPDILTNTYELLPLNLSQAEDAIINPIYVEGDFVSPRFDYDNDALEMILNYLTKAGKNQIETFQIQILCQYCENLVIDNKDLEVSHLGLPIIKKEYLGEIEDIYENFYTSLVLKFSKPQRKAIKLLIEDNLIVKETRVSLPDKTILNFEGIDETILKALVNTHIIRGEENSVGGTSYELAHDTLIPPIIKERKKRLDRENQIFIFKQVKEKKLKAVQRTFLAACIALVFASFITVWIMFDHNKNIKYELKHENALNINAKEVEIKISNQAKKDLKAQNAQLEILKKIVLTNIDNKNKLYNKLYAGALDSIKLKNYDGAAYNLLICFDLTKNEKEKENIKNILDTIIIKL